MSDTLGVNENAGTSDSVSENKTANKHPHQADLDKAQSALTVGSVLSGISTFLHISGFIIYLAFNGASDFGGPVIVGVLVTLGLLASWAIIHAILSIVVTNALTAKYTIFYSSKTK
jgi:hypothetical protein